MAESKKTIAHFIDEHEAYLSSIKGSISRVNKERDAWMKEQRAWESAWVGAPVVARVAAAHPQESWWTALEKTTQPELRGIYKKAQETIAELVQSQQFAKNKIQECTSYSRTLGERMRDAEMVLNAANNKREQTAQALEKALDARHESGDNWLDTQVKKWKRQGVSARSPMAYDYSAPQPWWAMPWLLSVVHPEMATNMKSAAHFQQKTGKNLFEVTKGYYQRRDAFHQAQEAAGTAQREHKRVEQMYASLQEAKRTNDREVQRSVEWLLPEKGPTSVKAQSLHARATAIENVVKYCIMNNIAQVGDLVLELPNIEDYAQGAGKLAAMQEVNTALKTAANHWTQGEKGVERALFQLNRLARKHHRHAKVTMDTAATQIMTRDIEKASIALGTRLNLARPTLKQSTPFTAHSRSNGNETVVHHTTSGSSSDDTAFWTMAWMHLLLNTNASETAECNGTTLTPNSSQQVPLLDPVQFQNDYQNANAGLGLNMDTIWGLSTGVQNINVEPSAFSMGHNSSSITDRAASPFSVEITDIRIDTADLPATSHSGNSVSSHGNSHSHSYSQGASHTHSDTTTTDPGSSCGSGGGND